MLTNPYDMLRSRFLQYSDKMLFDLIKEDMSINGYTGDENYKTMTLNILDNFEQYGRFSEKQKLVVINYLIH
ncbi:hypothetical protein [Lysinibacillus sp. IITD104]|uniref:hypothetical protein n=1 Tax=Lysinibacillus sp. IITD104 TaxID=3116650 RepID=UPI002FD3454B